MGVVEIALSQVLAATPIALGEPRIGAAYHIHMLPLVSESKHQKLKVGPNKKLRNTLGSPTPAKHKSQRTHPFRTWGIAHPHLGEDSISEKRTIEHPSVPSGWRVAELSDISAADARPSLGKADHLGSRWPDEHITGAR